MWLLYARAPPPDSSYWPGRRWLAALDAVAWPALWVLVISRAPVPGGLVAGAVTALAVLSAAQRLHTAIRLNHRYRFTTWRWGRVLLRLSLLGLVLKLTLTR